MNFIEGIVKNSYNKHQHQYDNQTSRQFTMPPQTEVLPPNFKKQWDQISERYFYVDTTTGQSFWEIPGNHSNSVSGHQMQIQQKNNHSKLKTGLGVLGGITVLGAGYEIFEHEKHKRERQEERREERWEEHNPFFERNNDRFFEEQRDGFDETTVTDNFGDLDIIEDRRWF
ncbi:hypothetical protein HDU92_000551 [Lobulomyces angularis]|nr:hypothetical protein HDU92_000551 [Lobulomyces angularis]